MPPIITFTEKEVKSFDTMISVFEEEFETRDHVQGEMLRVMLKRLLIRSSRLVKNMKSVVELPDTQIELIRKFHVLVEGHFKKKHQVTDYVELLFKSPRTISNVFKKEVIQRHWPLSTNVLFPKLNGCYFFLLKPQSRFLMN